MKSVTSKPVGRRKWNASLMMSLAVIGGAHAKAEGLQADARVARALDISEVAEQKFLSIFQPSTDGELIAYEVCDTERAEFDAVQFPRCSIRIAASDGKQVYSVDSGKGVSMNPSWSPDSRKLAFYSNRTGQQRVWLWDSATGKEQMLIDLDIPWSEMRWRKPLRWTPDGTQIVLQVSFGSGEHRSAPSERNVATTSRPAWAKAPAASVRATVAHTTDQNLPVYGGWVDLVAVSVADSKVTRLVSNELIGYHWVAPNGRSIAFTVRQVGQQGSAKDTVNWDIQVLQLGTRKARVVASAVQYDGASVSWAPDSERLAFHSDTAEGSHCSVVNVRTQKATTLAGRGDFWTAGFAQPVWDADGRFIYAPGKRGVWRGDTVTGRLDPYVALDAHELEALMNVSAGSIIHSRGGLLLSVVDQGSRRPGLMRVDAGTGRANLVQEGELLHGIQGMSIAVKKGQATVYMAGGARQSNDLWSMDVRSLETKRITNINPGLAQYEFAPIRVLEYLSHDGERLKAALLMPADYQPGKRYPMLTWVYATMAMGSHSANQFGIGAMPMTNMHVLSTRGYAVLVPDIPVRKGTIAQDIMKSVMPAVDKAIEIGVADPDRLGVGGHSKGGYTTMVVVSHSRRFKAAIVNNGFADLLTGYSEPVFQTIVERETGGPPWEAPLEFISNSPMYSLGRIETPLLIQIGERDYRTPVNLSEQMFHGMKRAGGDATLVKYLDESHIVNQRDNLIDYWTRVIQFLDAKLKQ